MIETRPAQTDAYAVEWWDDSVPDGDRSYEYWNDVTVERTKPWWIDSESGVDNVAEWLAQSGLRRELEACLEEVGAEAAGGRWVGADLACGTGWAAPLLLELLSAKRLFLVDYSKHRLLQLAPPMLRHAGVSPHAVVLCIGSFYRLKVPDGALDFVLLSQAFHHADAPGLLLAEMHRVLRPGGVAVVTGEHRVPWLPTMYAKHVLRYVGSRAVPRSVQRLVRGRELSRPSLLLPSVARLLEPDRVTGDHYYTAEHYRLLFETAGFAWRSVRCAGVPTQAFILRRQ